MKVIEAPSKEKLGKSIFIAGGISSCQDWQKDLIELLKEEEIIIFNPRREKYENYENIEKEQITWEHNKIKLADAVSFWFPNETLCPITLFELGKVLMLNKPTFIGIDPIYKRKKDVEIQASLVNPNINIVYSIKELANQIKSWAKKF